MDASQLTFNAFEHLMWADDRPEAPMVFFMRISLDGVCDQDRFRQSVKRALVYHPLLRSFASGNAAFQTRSIKWQAAPDDALPFIDWADDASGYPIWDGTSSLTSIDITRELGFRFFVRVVEDKTIVLGQFHHALTDGRGACSFIADVFAVYHAMSVNGEAAQWRHPTNSESLATRASFHLTASEQKQRRVLDLRRIFRFFTHTAEPLRLKQNVTQVALRKLCTAKSFEIDGQDFLGLKTFAKEHGVTLNDVLLRDLFLVLDKWNESRIARRGRRVIRIAVALDMRRPGDESMPAANVVSMVFLDRKPREIKLRESLLKGISAETTFIKENFMGTALIRAARWFGRFRWGLKLLMRPSRLSACHSTAVLSNVGILLKDSQLPRDSDGTVNVGGLRIVGWELMPPYRLNTPIAIGVGTVGKSMRIAIHYNSLVMSEAEADELRVAFEAGVRSNIER